MRKPLFLTPPPVCIWGTLLSTKAFMTRTKVSSEIGYAAHLTAAAADKAVTGIKNKVEEKKYEMNLKKAVKAAQKEMAKVEKAVEKEVIKEENASSTENANMMSGNIVIDVEPEELKPVTEETNGPEIVADGGPDFSTLQRGVIYDTEEQGSVFVEVEKEDDELKPVTEEDVAEALRRMRSNQVK